MDTKESDNYLRLAYIVVEIVADALRAVFKREWDILYPAMTWKDDAASLANFKGLARPHRAPPTSKAWSSYNSLTNGDRHTWDITKLCYVLIYSKPLNLSVNKPSEYAAVDSLRQIRNDVLHKENAETHDVDFKRICKNVKTELKTFGATCHKHLNEVKSIKQRAFPKDTIEKLEKERDNARRDFLNEKRRQKRRMKYSIGLGLCLMLAIVGLIYFFVPPKVPSYFPEKASFSVAGRQDEIDTIVDGILSGTRITTLYGSRGIGKRTTALAVGQVLQEKWIPFPWISVVYVNLRGVKDMLTLQKRILQSFFIFTEFSASFRLKELFTNVIKRKTIIILDRLQDIFESEMKYVAKEFIIDMLDWNLQIAFILIHKTPVETAKYDTKTVCLTQLSTDDSILLLRNVAGKHSDTLENTVVKVSHGIPLILKLYGNVIKRNKTLLNDVLKDMNIAETGSMETDFFPNDEQIFRYIRALISHLNKAHQEILIFLSFSVDSVSRRAIIETFPKSENTVAELMDMGLIELVNLNEHTIRYSTIVHGICNAIIDETIQICKEIEMKYFENFVTVASRLGNALYEMNLRTNYLLHMLTDDQHNVKTMFDIGRKYSIVSDHFFEMLFKTSAMFTLELSQSFTRYAYYASALNFKNVDQLKFLSLLYAQSGRGDIYSFNHPDEFMKAYTLINESFELFEKEPVCRSNQPIREHGFCFLLYGKVIGLNLTNILKSKRFEVLYNPQRGLALVDIAIGIFSGVGMEEYLAEAWSCRGLLLMSASNFTHSVKAYERSLDVIKKLYGEHPFVASGYFNTAYSYYKMGGFNLLKAIALFNSSFTMLNNTIGSHRRTANALFYVGTCLQSVGKYDESKTVISKAFDIQNKVMTLHTDLTKAPRDKAESLYMNYLVTYAIPTAKRQLDVWSVTNEISLKSCFITYFVANCQRSVGKTEAAFGSYTLAEEKLSLLCRITDLSVCDFYKMVKEDISAIKNTSKNEGYPMTTKHESTLKSFTEVIKTFVYCLFYAGVILLLTVLFLYISLFRNTDIFNLFQSF